MSFGDGDLHVQVAQLKTENARLKQRNGELKALVRSLFNTTNTLRINGHAPTGRQLDHYEQRMAALGIEVDA